MANTKYKELEDAVFNKIKDLDLAQLPEETAYRIVRTYLRPAIVTFKQCKQDLSDRDDELEEFNFRLTDNNFIILVNNMVIEWLTSNYILTSNALKNRLSPSDFKSLSLPQMLSKALELRSTLKSENNQLAIDTSYENSNIFNAVINRKKVYS